MLVRQREKRLFNDERGTTKSSVEQLAERMLFVERQQKKLKDEQHFKNQAALSQANAHIAQTLRNSEKHPLDHQKGHKIHYKSGSCSFKAQSRDQKSYYSIIRKVGPPIGHYTPHYEQVLHQSSQYTINPSTSGVEKRKPIHAKKFCIQNKECSLEKRIQYHFNDQTKRGYQTTLERSMEDSIQDYSKRRPQTANLNAMRIKSTQLSMTPQNQKLSKKHHSVSFVQDLPHNQSQASYDLDNQKKSHQYRNRVQSAKSRSTLSTFKYASNDVRFQKFEKQVSREEQKTPFLNMHSLSGESPHEKRFEVSADPESVASKQHQVSDWSKVSPKNTLLNQVRQRFYHCGDYTPNFDKFQLKLDICCLNFKKQKGREPMGKKSQVAESLQARYHPQASHSLLGHIKQPQMVEFEKVIPRDNKMYYISEQINLNDFDKQIKKHRDKFSVFNCSIADKTHVKSQRKYRPSTSLTLRQQQTSTQYNSNANVQSLKQSELNSITHNVGNLSSFSNTPFNFEHQEAINQKLLR